ncbi:NAD(P)-dependent oxidoreductase [Paraburkholderia caribensis]|uniref:NAD(P)-dependent oxidoreductase n=1 Tax=Paraburkholderia caribensis TaxID=75105 RepID=UPI0031CF1BC0
MRRVIASPFQRASDCDIRTFYKPNTVEMESLMKDRVGFIGLGSMGKPMTQRLLAAGLDVHVFDVNPETVETLVADGATAHPSPKAVADEVDCVLLSLPSASVVERVIEGEDGVAAGTKVRRVIDLSTVGIASAQSIGVRLRNRGIEYVDAPVSGGIAGATNGKLAVMVACNEGVLEDISQILRQCGKIFHVGQEPGQAQAAKLANNLLSMTALAVTSEAMVLGAKLGISGQTLLDIINAGSGRNTATTDKFPAAVLTRRFDFGFQTGLAHKDLKLCVQEAASLGVPMFVGNAVCQMYAVTEAKQGPHSDFTSVCRVVEDWSSAEVKS